jgi:predicted RNase H-like HicB family nuclease
MKPMTDYTIVVRPDSNGTFVAYIPAIPGCHAWGKTTDEAGAELINVFEMIREEYSEQKLPLPENVELVIAHAS